MATSPILIPLDDIDGITSPAVQQTVLSLLTNRGATIDLTLPEA